MSATDKNKLINEAIRLFNNNPVNCPEFKYSDTWNMMESIGGRPAILFGMMLGTPERFRWKKHDLKYSLISALIDLGGAS